MSCIGLGSWCAFFACLPVLVELCVCVVQTVVIVDSIINCVLGSFGVHWVTGRLQEGGVGNVTHSFMPDLSPCVSTQTNIYTHTPPSLLLSQEGT